MQRRYPIWHEEEERERERERKRGTLMEWKRPAAKRSQRLDMRNRNQESASFYADTMWSPWETVYVGHGRSYKNSQLKPGFPYEFRVRTLGRKEDWDGNSPWSAQQMTHTVHGSATQERFPIFLRGTGAHNVEYSVIEIDRVRIYHRRDQKGLVLAVFSRLNMQLIHLRTYNTFNDANAANEMAEHLRRFDQSHIVVVVSVDAWERQTTVSLAKAMEYCGAYLFGQWARVFADHKRFESTSGSAATTDPAYPVYKKNTLDNFARNDFFTARTQLESLALLPEDAEIGGSGPKGVSLVEALGTQEAAQEFLTSLSTKAATSFQNFASGQVTMSKQFLRNFIVTNYIEKVNSEGIVDGTNAAVVGMETADLDHNAMSGNKHFGHPYSFIGIPGLGSGMGIESLMYPTSQYLRYGLVPHADIRMELFFDYVDGHYHFSAHKAALDKAPFYYRANPPQAETLHNPIP